MSQDNKQDFRVSYDPKHDVLYLTFSDDGNYYGDDLYCGA